MIRRIVQLELTSVCNRQCVYCGNATMRRPKGFASPEVVDRTISLLHQIGQTSSVGLHHFGESTLHPNLVEIIDQMNRAGITPFLNTNGDFLSDGMIGRLGAVRLESLMISGHAPEERRIDLWTRFTQAGIPTWWQSDVIGNAASLAGQLNFDGMKHGPPLTDPQAQCGFLAQERAIVLWNGDLTVCCFDYDGLGVFGSVLDPEPWLLTPKPFNLCTTCPGHPGG